METVDGDLDGFTEFKGTVEEFEKAELEAQPTPVPEGEVEIHEATIEQLQAYLSEQSKPQQPQDGRQEDITGAAPKQNTPELEAAEKQQAEKTEDAAEGQEAPESSEEKLARYRSAIEKQNLAFQRRSSELGLAKKELAALKEEKTKWLAENKDSFLEDPETVIDRKLEITKIDDKLREVDAHEVALGKRYEAIQTVSKHVPPDQLDIEAMAQSLIRDGIPSDYVSKFVQDPYSSVDGAFLVQLARRANAEKTIVGVVKYAKKLEAQIEELKGKPAKVLSQIEQASKSKHLNGFSGGAQQSRQTLSGSDISKLDLSAMSIEELQKLL